MGSQASGIAIPLSLLEIAPKSRFLYVNRPIRYGFRDGGKGSFVSMDGHLNNKNKKHSVRRIVTMHVIGQLHDDDI